MSILKDEAPAELQEQCEKLSSEIHPFKVVPYLQYDSDGPDEWRAMLLDPDGEELARWINPAGLHNHTVRLLISGLKVWGKKQFRLGAEHAVNRISDNFRKLL